MSNGGSTGHVLQSCVVQSLSPQYTQRVPRLRARRLQPLDVLPDREVISTMPSIFMQMQRAIPGSGVSSPAVSEYDLCGFTAEMGTAPFIATIHKKAVLSQR